MNTPCSRSICALLLLAAAGTAAAAQEFGEPKIPKSALEIDAERYVLRNGMVVLLAPDSGAGNAAVWMDFRAGALYEPPGHAGLAHLVEHVMAAGPTPQTDYAGLLEERRAEHFNATTSFDRMTFETVVPAEELPAALWAARDRLTAIPPLVDDAIVERNRRAVLEERALVDVDRPYGLFGEHVLRRIFADSHPLHHGTIGDPEELARCTAEDVRRFVAERLVPANAILAVTGRFDRAAVRARIEELFGELPPGARALAPRLPDPGDPLVDKKQEPLGRCPRVTLAWRFKDASPEEAEALALGAQIFTFMTDQAFDMRVGAELVEYDGERLFVMDVVVPYDEPMRVVHDDAEGFLRQLTLREMPVEVVQAANLELDRVALIELDSVAERAELLTAFEHRFEGRYRAADLLAWHWNIDRFVIRDTARQFLRRDAVEVHARPTRPRPPHLERQ
jgi:predicted Zn-dependent peptidase